VQYQHFHTAFTKEVSLLVEKIQCELLGLLLDIAPLAHEKMPILSTFYPLTIEWDSMLRPFIKQNAVPAQVNRVLSWVVLAKGTHFNSYTNALV
jgi:hypothetical protein